MSTAWYKVPNPRFTDNFLLKFKMFNKKSEWTQF